MAWRAEKGHLGSVEYVGCMQVKVKSQGLEASEGTALLRGLWECPQLWLSKGGTSRSGSLMES